MNKQARKILRRVLPIGLLIISSVVFADAQKMKTIKIYLQKEDVATGSEKLQPVSRRVDAETPLRRALESLFAPQITVEEERQGFSTATFGMKFIEVELKNGTATIKFSQPPNETNYGSLGAEIFAQSIEKTAKQFASVKRVKICAVGETFIDSELETPFPRCGKGK
jgi:spore germination protein GerM